MVIHRYSLCSLLSTAEYKKNRERWSSHPRIYVKAIHCVYQGSNYVARVVSYVINIFPKLLCVYLFSTICMVIPTTSEHIHIPWAFLWGSNRCSLWAKRVHDPLCALWPALQCRTKLYESEQMTLCEVQENASPAMGTCCTATENTEGYKDPWSLPYCRSGLNPDLEMHPVGTE